MFFWDLGDLVYPVHLEREDVDSRKKKILLRREMIHKNKILCSGAYERGRARSSQEGPGGAGEDKSLFNSYLSKNIMAVLSEVTFSRPFAIFKILLFSRLNVWARQHEADRQVRLVNLVLVFSQRWRCRALACPPPPWSWSSCLPPPWRWSSPRQTTR